MDVRMKKVPLPVRLLAGSGLSLLAVFVGFAGLLLPPFLLAFLLVPVFPFVFIGYRATGRCLYCYQSFETTKRSGGIRCKGCGNAMSIQNGFLRKT